MTKDLNTAREELIKELSDIGCLYPRVIEFILERDKRIFEPLVKRKKQVLKGANYTGEMWIGHECRAIDETLKLAGVE